MPVTKIDGALLHWTITGDGPAVLLLHSLGGSGDMWRTTVDRLAPHHRVLTLDARGHGGSQNAGAISVERYAADAIELIEHCAIDSVAVIGLSMGGQAGMHVAQMAPRRVSALVLPTPLSAKACPPMNACYRCVRASPRSAPLPLLRSIPAAA